MPTSRPAEWGGVAAAIALLVGRAFGIDDVDTVTAMAVVIGFLPAAVTAAVVWARGLRQPR